MVEQIKILYDGECPVCSNYMQMLRLKENYEPTLINIRDGGHDVDRAQEAGLNLNDGMVLIKGEHLYYGDDCIHRLALMSTPSTLFNKVNAMIFRHPRLSRVIYPLLVLGRKLLLTLLGRKPFEYPT